LDAAMAGEFEFDVVEIMGEAWDLVNGSKRVLLGAGAILFGANVLASAVSAVAQGPDPTEVNLVGLLVSLLSMVILYPIQAGAVLYAVKRAAGDESASFDDILSCFGQTLPILGLMLLQMLLTMLGVLLFLLPGIYLAIAYLAALPLLVERKVGIWDSLETSRKALTNCWFRLLLLFLALGVITGFGAVLTLGIGLIWLFPFFWLSLGVVYCKIFGYSGSSG
jgi:hypothetical protein